MSEELKVAVNELEKELLDPLDPLGRLVRRVGLNLQR